MNVICWRGGREVMNLGEWFNKLILDYLGYKVTYKCVGEVFMIIGSDFHAPKVSKVLETADMVHVWGQGNGYPNLTPARASSRVRVHALRGPITARVSGVSGVPLCDPGWLLPIVLPLDRRPSGETLHIPHHAQRPGKGTWIDVMLKQEQVVPTIQRIVNAKKVYTNTLHTMILCKAYGVPCELCEGELPMPQKWDDVFHSDLIPREHSTSALLASFPHV